MERITILTNPEKKTKLLNWETLKQMTPEQLEIIINGCHTGSDIDGVAVKYDKGVVRKDHYPNMNTYYPKAKRNEFIDGKSVDIFITGRKYRYRKITYESLKNLGISCKYIIFTPKGFKKSKLSLAEYKADVINKLQLSKYYEDDREIHNFLRSYCPNTEIIKVGGPAITTLG